MVEAIPKEEYEKRKIEDWQLEEWKDDFYEHAKKLRDSRARELRKAGYEVKVETFDYTDLGRFKLYRLTARKVKICDKCKALGSYIYSHYGVYYCWDKEGCFIFEGKDALPVPTPKWCPREV